MNRPLMQREASLEVRAKVAELLSQSLHYNRELARITRELIEIRARIALAAVKSE